MAKNLKLDSVTGDIRLKQVGNANELKLRSTSLTNADALAVNTLYEAVRLRDPETAEHCLNVARLALAMAVRFDPSNAALHYAAGLVHDVGKMGMPDAILKSPDRLDKRGKLITMRHASDGADLIKRLNLPVFLVEAVEHHHERYDGSGYSHSLSGVDIPLSSRILAIADTWTALTSGRPYMVAKTPMEALKIMADEAILFDPDVLDWFMSGMTNGDVYRQHAAMHSRSVPNALKSLVVEQDQGK